VLCARVAEYIQIVYNKYTMNKQQKGTYSELLAMAYYVKLGWFVSKPINDFGEYDLLIDNNTGKPLRVQVKTAYWDNSKKRYLISLVTSHIRGNGRKPNKKYKENSFDRLIAIEPNNQVIYEFSIFDVVGKRSITVYPDKEIETNRYKMF